MINAHVDHTKLEGFDERQLFYDGCGECEFLTRNIPTSLGSFDDEGLLKAIKRGTSWTNGNLEELGRISRAELPLLQFFETFFLAQDLMVNVFQRQFKEQVKSS